MQRPLIVKSESDMFMQFRVEGQPVPQPRQRHRVVRGVAMNYTPAKHPVQAYKQAIEFSALTRRPSGWVLDDVMAVELVFVMPRPGRLKPKKFPGRVLNTTRPDLDNLGKACLDSLIGVLWVDDGRIAALKVVKFYAAPGEKPHTVMRAYSGPDADRYIANEFAADVGSDTVPEAIAVTL